MRREDEVKWRKCSNSTAKKTVGNSCQWTELGPGGGKARRAQVENNVAIDANRKKGQRSEAFVKGVLPIHENKRARMNISGEPIGGGHLHRENSHFTGRGLAAGNNLQKRKDAAVPKERGRLPGRAVTGQTGSLQRYAKKKKESLRAIRKCIKVMVENKCYRPLREPSQTIAERLPLTKKKGAIDGGLQRS